VPQEALCMHRVSDEELDKENFGRLKKKAKTDGFSPSISRIPTAGMRASVNSQSVNALAYDNPEDHWGDDRDAFVSTSDETQDVTLFSVLEERWVLELQILNAALYKPEVTSENVSLSSFTPTKVQGYHRAGGETLELERSIGILKTLYPEPIRDTVQFPRSDQQIFSPAARHLPRRDVAKLRSLKLVSHLPDYAIVEPLVIETEEERAARKEKQEKEFEASEIILGNLPKQLISEREKILKPWVPYFNYVEMKKNQLLQGIGAKMRWPELAEAFMKYVAPHMEFLEIEGFEVYFSLQVINFKRKNPKNQKENHETMGEGQAPTGVDGKPIHLHHVLQICACSHPMKITESMRKNRQSPYKLTYLPEFMHTEYTEFLHPVNYVTPKAEINRSSFGESRKVIHKKVAEVKYSPK
jgi:hypothetical protein